MEDDLDSDSLSPVQAYAAVRRFSQRAGALPMRLALHAAMPQVLHADLLHLLRLNFVDDGRSNPVAEADVLFSAFCSDLGQAYYRFDPHARVLLLAELDAAYPGERPQRSQLVADFLLAWFERERAGERAGTDAMYRSWIEVERWNALAFADPDGAAEQLAQALQHATDPAQATARLRVGTLAQSLAQPLLRHQRLLDYAAGVQALQSDSMAAAQALLRRVGDAPLAVGAVTLPPARQVVAQLGKAAAPAAAPVGARDADGPASTPPDAAPMPSPEQARPNPSAAPATATAAGTSGYSAYISYSYTDDALWNGWIGDFAKELERGLRARLRGLPLAPLHLSGADLPTSGLLRDTVRQRVGASFSMIVVVHDGYAGSAWGLTEIAAFRAVHGDAALRERLYIVAMSETAMQRLAEQAAWRELGLEDRVWLAFFDRTERDRPVPIYSQPGILSNDFWEPFGNLRDHLVEQLRRTKEPAAAPPPRPPQPDPATDAASATTEVAVGYRAGGPAARLDEDRLHQLQASGVRVLQVSQVDALVGGHPALVRARHLVLPFDNQQVEGEDGGHLGILSRAWLGLGRHPSAISWVDMRAPGEARASAGAARWVQAQGVHTQPLADWMVAFRRGLAQPDAPPQARGACVYIESNRWERTHWEAIGKLLQRRWPRLVESRSPGLRLTVRALPMDELDQYPTLDEADGLVLLWGRKSPEALVAQVNRVEQKLSPGADIAPGLIAYLMPPRPAVNEPVPAWGWRVLRFHVVDFGPESESAERVDGLEIDIVEDEANDLDRFLRGVLDHHAQRLPSVGDPPLPA